MKQLSRFLVGLFLVLSLTAIAQNCAPTYKGSFPLLPVAKFGFGKSLSDTCIARGTAVDVTIPFREYYVFPSAVGPIPVKRLRFDSIENLPCGLCWSSNKADNSFINGEDGCIHITGTTNDPIGQYKLRILLSVNSTDTMPVYPFILTGQNADLGHIYYYLIVKNTGGTCAAPDTNSASLSRSASCSPAAIHDLSSNITTVNITPNPMNRETKATFIADKNATATLRLVSIVGSEIWSKSVDIHTGYNELTISRGSLSEGMYLLTLSTGSSTVTRRLIVTD
jgi:Secretion system C-terminal sorting domain